MDTPAGSFTYHFLKNLIGYGVSVTHGCVTYLCYEVLGE